MYLVRRYLYFSWDEWENLPGYQQQAYVRVLKKAKPWTTDGGDDKSSPGGGGGGGSAMDIEQPMKLR